MQNTLNQSNRHRLSFGLKDWMLDLTWSYLHSPAYRAPTFPSHERIHIRPLGGMNVKALFDASKIVKTLPTGTTI